MAFRSVRSFWTDGWMMDEKIILRFTVGILSSAVVGLAAWVVNAEGRISGLEANSGIGRRYTRTDAAEDREAVHARLDRMDGRIHRLEH